MQRLDELKPTVWIGKKGLESLVLSEIQNQLKRKGLIKVKVQKNIKDEFDNILGQILSKTNSVLIEQKGLTFVLSKKSE